jgi:hypothetical protein
MLILLIQKVDIEYAKRLIVLKYKLKITNRRCINTHTDASENYSKFFCNTIE